MGFWHSGSGCRRLEPALALALLGACGGSPTGPEAPPAPAGTREGRRLQDADDLASQLERLHPNLFFHTTRAEFQRALEDVKARAALLEEHEFAVALMRLAALPGDGHTALSIPPGFRRLPLRLSRLAGGIYVTGAEPAAAAALGARVVAIGERGIQEALDAVAQAISHENQALLDARAPALLVAPEILHALGVVPDPALVPLLLEDERGARFRVFAAAQPAAAVPGLLDLTASAGALLPLHRQRPSENYWFTLLEDSATLYLQYNRCRDGAEPFASFAQRLFRSLDENPRVRLVVDVRHNPGGSSSVDDPLIRGLEQRPERRARGRLFCLIGGETFSSGLWSANDLRKLGAVLIGGPTGGKPNSYGNVQSFLLPNSGLTVSYSTTYYRLFDDSDPASLFPELFVEPSIADYREGRDPLLAAAIGYRLP